VYADARTNSLLSGDKAARLRMRVDRAPRLAVDTGEVIYLNYAKAAELAPILEGVAPHRGQPGDHVKTATIQAYPRTTR
jgi:hypothetical protein